MTRLTTALLFLLTFIPAASASLAPRADRLPAPRAELEPAPVQPQRKLVLTEQTEVRLNGRACRIAEVPPNAEVILLDLAADRTTIRKIHFRSKK